MRTALYYIRSRCNYSQSMVARELHVSRQMFSAWENGTKSIPNARKAELADMFGIEKEKLDETDEAVILAYCDQPMFSRICQGKQVFSFAPEYRHSRVFLGIPQESPPGEQCKDLMSRKNKIMERIDSIPPDSTDTPTVAEVSELVAAILHHIGVQEDANSFEEYGPDLTN